MRASRLHRRTALSMVIGHGVPGASSKTFSGVLRIAVDYPKTSYPSVDKTGSLETVRVNDGHMALLGPSFLFQGLEQSAAVAVAAEAGMNPEILDLHTLAPDCPHDPAHQLAMAVMEKDGHVSTGIDSRGGDVVGDELVAYSLDLHGHWDGGLSPTGGASRLLLSRRLPPITVMMSLHDLANSLSCFTLGLGRCRSGSDARADAGSRLQAVIRPGVALDT